MNEAFKKQLLSSHEYFQAKRWEGKPLKYRIKYLYANYPELALSVVVFGILAPIVLSYKYINFPGSRNDVIRKYRQKFIVVRDDHPNLADIIKEKEAGREFFPKY